MHGFVAAPLACVLSRARTNACTRAPHWHYTYLWRANRDIERTGGGAASAEPIKVQIYGDADEIPSSTVTGHKTLIKPKHGPN